MKQYTGIDVSLEYSSVCVVDVMAASCVKPRYSASPTR
jgi:hypothetical protein